MGMRSSRALALSWAACAGVSAGLWLPQPAAACSLAEPPQFQLDPSLAGVDTTPPTAFRALEGATRQVSGTRCEGGTCTESSCGDSGTLELKFVAPEDDHASTAELGYRVVWLRGRMPSAMQDAIDHVQVLGSSGRIVINLGFTGVTELDGELGLVAVDRAGNESATSEPLAVRWSGCMSYFDSPNTCEVRSPACSVRGAPGHLGRGVGTAALILPLAAAGVLRLRRRSNIARR